MGSVRISEAGVLDEVPQEKLSFLEERVQGCHYLLYVDENCELIPATSISLLP